MSKIFQLLSILPSRPLEAIDRLRTVAEVKIDELFRSAPQYGTVEWDAAIYGLSHALGDDLLVYLGEEAMQCVESTVLETIAKLPPEAPFRLSHNGDIRLAKLSYAICRSLRPEVAMETGTCYGVSTAFILKALQLNGFGSLHSIDLPPLGNMADKFVGFVVPRELKTRWILHRGVSRRIMPKLLRNLTKIDFFLHDSLHTYGTISMECNLIYPFLSQRGVIMVDDIEANAAFRDWLNCAHPEFAVVIEEMQKKAMFGVSYFSNLSPKFKQINQKPLHAY